MKNMYKNIKEAKYIKSKYKNIKKYMKSKYKDIKEII